MDLSGTGSTGCGSLIRWTTLRTLGYGTTTVDLSGTDKAAWRAALADLRRDAQRQRWRADPVAWVTERLGEHVWSKQGEIMRAVRDNRLTVVQSSHGVGKSHLASRVVGYYLDNWPKGDFVVVSTAPTWKQVRNVLWRYVGQMVADNELPGAVNQQAEWKIGSGADALVAFGIKPADHDHQGMQGIHGRRGVIGIVDEGSGVPDQIFNAMDSLATTLESRILVIGNPDNISSRFYKLCTSEPKWHRMKINSFDTPAWTGEAVPDAVRDPQTGTIKGLVDPSWVADKAERWGRESALFKIKVLGEFAEEDDLAVIPRAWVMAAVRRWEEADDALTVTGRTVFGVDVGHMGEDRTVIATRKGDRVLAVESWAKRDTVAVANLIEARSADWVQPTIVVDGIGVGAGVVDQLRTRGLAVHSFIASRTTKIMDGTGSFRFLNLRAASWWHLRELLDPTMDARLALPPDDDLINDLITPRFEMVAGGKVKIEGKDDIRKRLGRSTDYADACLAAGTMITTDSGPIPIERVRPGDRVWTRVGWRVVEHSGMTNPAAELITVTLADGREITGTGNHPVWDGQRFRSLDAFVQADSMAVCPDPNALNTEASRSPDTRIPPTDSIVCTTGQPSGSGKPVSGHSMSRCSGRSVETFRRGGTFITATMIRWTTGLKTLSVFRRGNTGGTIPPVAGVVGMLNTWPVFRSWPRRGTRLRKGWPGTASTDAVPGSDASAWMSAPVPGAVNRSTVSWPKRAAELIVGAVAGASRSMRIGTVGTTETLSARFVGPVSRPGGPLLVPVPVVRTCAAGIGPVWNLQVQGQPEYLANGILVHNCVMAMWIERYERVYANDQRVALEPVPYAGRYQAEDPLEDEWDRRAARAIAAGNEQLATLGEPLRYADSFGWEDEDHGRPINPDLW